MNDGPRISVVIPTHNRSAKLAMTLDRLADQTVPSGWEVIVVANNCTDETVALVTRRAQQFPVPLVAIEELSPGAAAARNTGARHASAADILFLDDDILVEPGCLQRTVKDRCEHPGAWIVGQVHPLAEHQASSFGAFRSASMPPAPSDGPVTEVQWFASGLALVPKHDLLTLGGYERSFTTAALEDVDLAIRAHRAAHRIMFDPGLVGYHNDWAGTSIRDFCYRARLYCATAIQLEERFGRHGHPWSDLLNRNSPPRWTHDPPQLVARKLLKAAAGSKGPLQVLLGAAERLERLHTPPMLLWPIYRAAIAGSMYAGYQEGLRRASTEPPRT